MNLLVGIKNVLQFINDNWVMIVIILGLLLMIYKKVKKYLSLSTQDKIETAKVQLSNVILKLVSDAEFQYNELRKAGSVKRSQVIDKIFNEYPILSKVTSQEALIEWIDKLIDEALITVRRMVSDNTNQTISQLSSK